MPRLSMISENSSKLTHSNKSNSEDNELSSQNEYRESLQLVTLNQANERIVITFTILLIVFVSTYFIVGVTVYSQWVGWSPFDAFYYSVITFTTVGYGDYTPETDNERLFTSFFVILGVGILGSSAAVLRSQVAAHQERIAIMKQSESMVILENRIRSSINSIEETIEQEVENVKKAVTKRPSSLKSIFNSITGFPSFSNERNSASIKIEAIKSAVIDSYNDEVKALKWSLLVNFFIILAIIGIGGLCMAFIENWDGITAVYWACITITTVGYGDVVPTCNLGKAFTIVYALVGCGYMAKSIEDIAKVPVAMRLKQSEIEVLNQFTCDLSQQKLRKIFMNDFFKKIPRLRHKNDELKKSEFVLLLLNMMNKIDEKDLLIVAEIFEKMDRNGNGVLSNDEMNAQLLNAKSEPEENRKEKSPRKMSYLSNMIRTFSDDSAARQSTMINQPTNNVTSAMHNNESF